MNDIINKIKINNNSLPIIKGLFIEFLNSKIKVVNTLFEFIININKDYEKFTLLLVKSYEYLNSNFSINKNIEINLYEKLKAVNVNYTKEWLYSDRFIAICKF